MKLSSSFQDSDDEDGDDDEEDAHEERRRRENRRRESDQQQVRLVSSPGDQFHCYLISKTSYIRTVLGVEIKYTVEPRYPDTQGYYCVWITTHFLALSGLPDNETALSVSLSGRVRIKVHKCIKYIRNSVSTKYLGIATLLSAS